uniref:Uncharacterized protein n=1 Tax=Percolomonas cosmopolitus TaxID=63605 RepID=A0A7S1PFJ4_9EUKA|mmetsp:Transcript_11686/g.43944  ORF Transcript_11686/g.43944 Transcript_11686/m.43944 type:complete len:485 (+) Transcript_11686:18-1472(+)
MSLQTFPTEMWTEIVQFLPLNHRCLFPMEIMHAHQPADSSSSTQASQKNPVFFSMRHISMSIRCVVMKYLHFDGESDRNRLNAMMRPSRKRTRNYTMNNGGIAKEPLPGMSPTGAIEEESLYQMLKAILWSVTESADRCTVANLGSVFNYLLLVPDSHARIVLWLVLDLVDMFHTSDVESNIEEYLRRMLEVRQPSQESNAQPHSSSFRVSRCLMRDIFLHACHLDEKRWIEKMWHSYYKSAQIPDLVDSGMLDCCVNDSLGVLIWLLDMWKEQTQQAAHKEYDLVLDILKHGIWCGSELIVEYLVHDSGAFAASTFPSTTFMIACGNGTEKMIMSFLKFFASMGSSLDGNSALIIQRGIIQAMGENVEGLQVLLHWAEHNNVDLDHNDLLLSALSPITDSETIDLLARHASLQETFVPSDVVVEQLYEAGYFDVVDHLQQRQSNDSGEMSSGIEMELKAQIEEVEETMELKVQDELTQESTNA